MAYWRNVTELEKLANINIRKPFLNGPPSAVLKTVIPLCSQFPEEGTIDFYSSHEIDDYEGLFSFVLYYNQDIESFKTTKYYTGLLIYIEIVHRIPFFKNYGVVIYTDEYTFAMLRPLLLMYPKTILAITHWEQFKISYKITGTVLRCLRFQALEAFPTSHILVRDADTLFVPEIAGLDHIYSRGYKATDIETGTIIEDNREYLIEKIGAWEQQFIELWFRERLPLLFGINLFYKDIWHADFPFIWPRKMYHNTRSTLKTRMPGVEKETSGRFNDYKERYGLQLYIEGPAGIFAGFTNFSNGRPDDLWLLSFDYIQTRYKVITTSRGENISNTQLWIDSLGKDERILIFAILIKYWALCFFLSINYTINNTQVFLKDDFKSKNSDLQPIVNIGTVKYKKNNRIMTNHLKMWSLLLHNNYLPSAFNKTLDAKTFKEWYGKSIMVEGPFLNDPLKETNVGKTINQIYREHFHNFAPVYMSWLDAIMSKSEKSISRIIQTLINSERATEGYITDYLSISPNNFYEPPRRILPSRLNKTKKNKN
jgi:hypothetical protein